CRIHHRRVARKLLRSYRTAEELDMFDDLLAHVALTNLIGSVHHALRILKHRADAGSHGTASALKGLKAEPAPDEKGLALQLIKEIEKKEKKPIERLGETRAAYYITTLA